MWSWVSCARLLVVTVTSCSWLAGVGCSGVANSDGANGHPQDGRQSAQGAPFLGELKIVFDTVHIEHGMFLEGRDHPTINARFVFHNRTGSRIKIDGVTTNCGCTTADHSTEWIGQNEAGHLVLSTNPGGRSGKYIARAEVTFRQINSHDILRRHLALSMYVVRKPSVFPKLVDLPDGSDDSTAEAKLVHFIVPMRRDEAARPDIRIERRGGGEGPGAARATIVDLQAEEIPCDINVGEGVVLLRGTIQVERIERGAVATKEKEVEFFDVLVANYFEPIVFGVRLWGRK